MAVSHLLSQVVGPTAASSVEDPFLQAGIAGAVALVLGTVVLRLYTQLQASNKATTERLEASHAAELSRLDAAHKVALDRADAVLSAAVARADRMENELRDVNKLMTDKVIVELVRASDVVRRAVDSTERR